LSGTSGERDKVRCYLDLKTTFGYSKKVIYCKNVIHFCDNEVFVPKKASNL
jgi:hypothetical protein